jgi:hypothetical protein
VRTSRATVVTLALALVLATASPVGSALAEGTAILALDVRGTGTGAVTSDGIACSGDCTATFAAGTSVELVAAADPGSTFVGWGGGCEGTGPCRVTLDGDLSIVARFADTLRPSLMVGRSGSGPYRGRWVVDPAAGSSQTLAARASRGQRVAFVVRVVNDGVVPDDVVLSGTGDRGGVSVAYRSRGVDVTDRVVAGTFTVSDLPPGSDAFLRVVIEVAAAAKIGAERAWVVAGRSALEPGPSDAVRAEVRVVWAPVPLARAVGITLVEPARAVAFAGYHQSLFGSAAALEPLAGAVVMASRGRGTPATSAVDVVMAAGTPVLAPVTGRVASVTPYRVYCDVPDVRVVIRPAEDRTRTVLVLHLAAVRVATGDLVEAGRTVLGVPRDLGYHDQVDDYGAAGRPHVHIEIERDGSSPLPGCR